MNEQRMAYELQQRWSAHKEEAASRAAILMTQQLELVVWVRDWEHRCGRVLLNKESYEGT